MAGTLDDIVQLELKQLNENSKSMTTDIKQIKEILNAQYTYTIEASENKEAFARNEKQLAEQRAQVKQDLMHEEDKKDQAETQKKLDALTEATRQSNKNIGDNGKIANSYLDSLMRMSRDNLVEQKRKKSESVMGKLGAGIDALGSQPYGRNSDITNFSVKSTADLLSGFKSLFTDVVGVSKKIGGLFGKGSEGRNRTIKKDSNAINRLQMQKTTREQEADDLEASGQTEKAEAMRKTIEDLQNQIDKKAKSLSTATSTEYMSQLKKSDKEFKKIDSGDQELMMKQMSEKMFASITGKSSALDVSKLASSLSDKPDALHTGRDEVGLQSGVSNQEALHAKEIAHADVLHAKEIAHADALHAKEIAHIENRYAKKDAGATESNNATTFLSTPISASGEPTNVGQYIAGIYKKLSGIETILKRKSRIGSGGDSGGGEEKEDEEGGEGGLFTALTGGSLSAAALAAKTKALKLGASAWNGIKNTGSKAFKSVKGLFGGAAGAGAEALGGGAELAGGAAEAAGGAARTAEAAVEGGSKFSRLLGAGGRLGGKLLMPAMAAYDTYTGATGSDEEVAKRLGNKPGGDIGFGERAQSGMTSMLSGVTLGTLSSQSINKTLGSLGEGDMGGMWQGVKGLTGDAATASTRLMEMLGLQEEGTADNFRRESGLTADENLLNPEIPQSKSPEVGPQSSAPMPEQRQVAMMTPSAPDNTSDRDIAGYQIQATLFADAMAKRNMQSDVKHENMMPVRANQSFLSSLLGWG